MRAVLPAICAVGIVAAAAWMLAGGGGGPRETVPFSVLLFGHSDPAVVAGSSGAPVHIDSSPAGAQVRIDGSRAGTTPLDLPLEAGQHTLSLQHPDALDDERTLEVGDTGAAVNVELWQRRPEVLPLGSVYPGAALLDARFLDDGRVALLVGLADASQVNPGAPPAGRELWLLDPVAGQPSRVTMPGLGMPATTMVLAPDGNQVAYVTPGSAAPVTATGWSSAGRASSATPQTPQMIQPEAVWLAPLDASLPPPRRILELPSPTGSDASPDTEHVVDLVWTPDRSRLVAITRQTGPPVRSRVLLLKVAPGSGESRPDPEELARLPAEVVPYSTVPDPSGRWLALVTHAAGPAGGNLFSLCAVELRAGGTFRDLADLGSGAGHPAVAPVTWAPEVAGAADRLVFAGPAPAASSSNNELFSIFGALRPAPSPLGLFMANLEGSGLLESQPHRLGTAINNFGLVWRFPTTLYGFARQDDGTLALHSIDPDSGAVRDLGVRMHGIAGGTGGLSARWDSRHGRALLLAHAPVSSMANAGGGPLQAWLVSFITPSAQPGGSS